MWRWSRLACNVLQQFRAHLQHGKILILPTRPSRQSSRRWRIHKLRHRRMLSPPNFLSKSERNPSPKSLRPLNSLTRLWETLRKKKAYSDPQAAPSLDHSNLCPSQLTADFRGSYSTAAIRIWLRSRYCDQLYQRTDWRKRHSPCSLLLAQTIEKSLWTEGVLS